ncbi:MAG: hypothetical protein K0S07_1341 [Chlamydiales bacterium]|jgi:hypothetical protein|nr:hypothetical protein [Chlamydiales bacterium]
MIIDGNQIAKTIKQELKEKLTQSLSKTSLLRGILPPFRGHDLADLTRSITNTIPLMKQRPSKAPLKYR